MLRIDAGFLDGVLTKAYIAVTKDGWIVVRVTGDGASENCSYFKRTETISVRDVFDGHYDKESLRGLQLDFNITFPHPDKSMQENGVTIIISGEMPHWGKKFRNGMDSSKRILTYRGQEISLSILKDI